jgi:5-methylcytosine-specific restriction endonuclease McrA
MPIRREFRPLYPKNWPELSRRVRFERAGGRCQRCGRPHLSQVRCLPDGRWFDTTARTWRDRRGRPTRWPDLIDAGDFRMTLVVLAAAHLDNNPSNNRLANLRGLCQRCHMLHDRPFHLAQRWLTYRRRWAIGDLFLGRYVTEPSSATLFAMAYRAHRWVGTNRRPTPAPDHLNERQGVGRGNDCIYLI